MFSSGFQNVVGMSLALGAVSYVVGLAPLSVPLSSMYPSRRGLGSQSNRRDKKKNSPCYPT